MEGERGDLVSRVQDALQLDPVVVDQMRENDRRAREQDAQQWLDEAVQPVLILFAVPGFPLTERMPAGVSLREAVRAG